MSRWTSNSRGRLEQAAYDLFLDRGYEQTTVADIASRAGLTERTFFRHYADKREVLFGGSDTLKEEIVRVADGAAPGLSTIAIVRATVEAISSLMHGRRELSRERQRLVNAHSALQERELIKRATLTGVLSQALQRRGVSERAADLAADMGLGVFHVGFAHWLAEAGTRELIDVVRDDFEALQAVASGT